MFICGSFDNVLFDFFSMSALKCSRHCQLRILINCNCKCVFELFRFHSKFCGNSYDLVFDERNSYNVPFYIYSPKKTDHFNAHYNKSRHTHTHTTVCGHNYRWRFPMATAYKFNLFSFHVFLSLALFFFFFLIFDSHSNNKFQYCASSDRFVVLHFFLSHSSDARLLPLTVSHWMKNEAAMRLKKFFH